MRCLVFLFKTTSFEVLHSFRSLKMSLSWGGWPSWVPMMVGCISSRHFLRIGRRCSHALGVAWSSSLWRRLNEQTRTGEWLGVLVFSVILGYLRWSSGSFLFYAFSWIDIHHWLVVRSEQWKIVDARGSDAFVYWPASFDESLARIIEYE